MFYKKYGNTDMEVSAIGLGTMRYDEADVQAGRFEKCAEIPLYAFEKGINYFDTAPFYCNDKSEEITGLALSQLKRDSYFLSSKTNFGAIGQTINEDTFRRRLETSLTRLKTDHLDFYHLWCVLSPEGYEKECNALYGFFEKAKAEGLIRNIVFSSHMQGDGIANVVESGLFRGMLIGYNALNYRFRQTGIERAYEKGMGVVVMNPLGGGLIPKAPAAFSYLTEGTDLTVAQAALRFVASHREITVALAGCTTKAHIDDGVRAVENLELFAAKELVQRYSESGLALNNLCTGCGYCKGCPEEIEIPKYMDAYNEMLLGGGTADVLDRLTDHWGIEKKLAGRCIACRKCEKQCTQHLPIIERLKEIAQMG